MKQMEVQKIPYGETFRVFDDTFVALDRVDGGVLAIRRDIWKNAPFDKDGRNDFRRASIRDELNNYLIDFWKNWANWESTIAATIDLKSTDGTREYGYYGMGAVLLTLEQYGKYQHIIPDAACWWWLVTPWKTPADRCGGSGCSWLVGSHGYSGCCCCSDSHGIRPALVFAPSLLVEYDDGDEETGGTDGEETIYDDYLEYVDLWIMRDSDKRKLGVSPLSYEAWKAKSGEQVSG